MEQVIQRARTLPLVRVECGDSSTAPVGIAFSLISPPAPAGVFALTQAITPTVSAHDGVPAAARVIAGLAGASGSYTLRVYGLHKCGSVWQSVLLWQGTVNCNYAPGGDRAADSFATGDYAAGEYTVGAGIDATSYRITNPGGTGMASLTVDSAGCPYLVFQASNADAYVMAAGQT